MAKPNPYLRHPMPAAKGYAADAGQRSNFKFLNDLLPQSLQQRDSFSLPRNLNTPHNRSILPAPTQIRGKQSKSPILDYIKGNEFIKKRISRVNNKNSCSKNQGSTLSKITDEDASNGVTSPKITGREGEQKPA